MRTSAEYPRSPSLNLGTVLAPSIAVLHPAVHSRAPVCQAQQVMQLKHHLHGQALNVAVREMYHMKWRRRGRIEAAATN